MPDISIVIPTLGQSEALAQVIAGIERQAFHPLGADVCVVIDARGNADRVRGLVGGADGVPLQVLTATYPGASAARNLGWRSSTAPIVLFLDDDIVPSPRLVAEHLAWHRSNPRPEVGVLGAVRWSPMVKVTPFMRWLEMGIQFDYRTIKGVEVEWQRFYSCNISVKRPMLELSGGFDERRFPFGYEDLELARRLWYGHGLRLLYNRAAVGEHLKSETLDSWRRNLPRIATAERRFTQLYPGEPAYFYRRFAAAADAPPARGRTARLARFIRPGVPWLGRKVWRSFDILCTQRLAPEFLARWEASDVADT